MQSLTNGMGEPGMVMVQVSPGWGNKLSSAGKDWGIAAASASS